MRCNDELVNRHDFAPVPAGCAPDVRHRFGGDHALGGERRDREAFGRWHATQPIADGSPYLDRGVHIFRLRWGKLVDVDVHEDSQLVAGFLAAEADRGVAAAGAEKITS